MNHIPEYRGYMANVVIDFEGHILHGHIDGISDLVTFESETVDGIVKEFHDAVDDYIEFCHEHGKKPEISSYPVSAIA